MKIKDVIGPEQVEVGLRVSDKAQLLRELSRRAAAAVSIDQSVIHDALLARENSRIHRPRQGLCLAACQT